jgi:hypothetical protein
VANVRTGNTHYVDSTGNLGTDPEIVLGFLLTATSANAIANIQDTGSNNKINLRVATSGDTKLFDLSQSPLTFPKGVKVSTLTNAILTVIYK